MAIISIPAGTTQNAKVAANPARTGLYMRLGIGCPAVYCSPTATYDPNQKILLEEDTYFNFTGAFLTPAYSFLGLDRSTVIDTVEL